MAWANFCSVWLASTTPSLVGPLLSCTSSSATRSGDLRLRTTIWASPANLLSGSPVSRFSTFRVAAVSSLALGSANETTSRTRPPAVTGGRVWLTNSLKLAKL